MYNLYEIDDVYLKYYNLKNISLFSFFMLFYNINYSTSFKIIRRLGVPMNLHIRTLGLNTDLDSIFFVIRDNFYFNYLNYKFKRLVFLKTLNTFKGVRYNKNLPIRGQRTKTNAKTRKKFNIL